MEHRFRPVVRACARIRSIGREGGRARRPTGCHAGRSSASSRTWRPSSRGSVELKGQGAEALSVMTDGERVFRESLDGTYTVTRRSWEARPSSSRTRIRSLGAPCGSRRHRPSHGDREGGRARSSRFSDGHDDRWRRVSPGEAQHSANGPAAYTDVLKLRPRRFRRGRLGWSGGLHGDRARVLLHHRRDQHLRRVRPPVEEAGVFDLIDRIDIKTGGY